MAFGDDKDKRRLPALAHTVNTAMAHEVALSGTTVKGVPFSGLVKCKEHVEGFKSDPKVKDRSPIIVCFEDGSKIKLEDMHDCWLGAST